MYFNAHADSELQGYRFKTGGTGIHFDGAQFEAGGRQQGGDQALNLGFPFLYLGAASIKQLDTCYQQTVTGSG